MCRFARVSYITLVGDWELESKLYYSRQGDWEVESKLYHSCGVEREVMKKKSPFKTFIVLNLKSNRSLAHRYRPFLANPVSFFLLHESNTACRHLYNPRRELSHPLLLRVAVGLTFRSATLASREQHDFYTST